MATITPLYDFSIVPFSNSLKNLLHCLNKAEEHAKSKGEDVNEYKDLRLYEDMKTFTAQIQYATDAAKTAFVRLSDKNLSDYSLPDTESTWEELKTRITKTLEILRTANPKDFAGREHEEILIAQGRVSMTGIQALQTYFAPNFYFHVSTAYGLLRMKGVPLGKVDLLLGEKGFAGVNAVKPAA